MLPVRVPKETIDDILQAGTAKVLCSGYVEKHLDRVIVLGGAFNRRVVVVVVVGVSSLGFLSSPPLRETTMVLKTFLYVWNSSLFQTGLFISSTWLLGSILVYFKNRNNDKNSTSSRTALTKKEQVARAVVVLFGLWQCYLAFAAPPRDIFRELSVPFESPNFVLRNSVRDYVVQKSATDEAFAREAENSKSGVGKPDQTVVKQFGHEPESEYARLELLVELLRTSGNRGIYSLYGEDALLTCTWCRETSDYLLYVIPSVLRDYVIAAVAFGIGTSSRRKAHWRTYVVFAVILFGVADAMAHFLGQDLPEELGGPSLHQGSCYVRRLAFATVAFVMAATRGAVDTRTDAERVASLVASQEVLYHRNQAASLLRGAVDSDGNLGKIRSEYYRREQIESDLVDTLPDVVSARERARMRLDLDAVMEDASSFVDQIVQFGNMEGKPGTETGQNVKDKESNMEGKPETETEQNVKDKES